MSSKPVDGFAAAGRWAAGAEGRDAGAARRGRHSAALHRRRLTGAHAFAGAEQLHLGGDDVAGVLLDAIRW